jgi:hypothetical protein
MEADENGMIIVPEDNLDLVAFKLSIMKIFRVYIMNKCTKVKFTEVKVED